MKKSEIKRRKRVVPMTGNTIEHISQSHNDAASDVDASMSSSVYSGHDRTSPSDSDTFPRTTGLPIPVDFTSSFRNARPPAAHPQRDQDDQSQSADGSTRKRSFSATAEENHNTNNRESSYPHPQDVVMHDAPSDTARSHGGETDLSIRSLLSSDTPSKETRRLALRREAERMRQALLEKERELAELGEEG
jgi:hypothetical protein